jgi:hypothetical protein
VERNTEPQFEAGFSIFSTHKSRIGLRRLKRIDLRGRVEIADGRLTLHRSTGEPVVDAPVSDISAKAVYRGRAADIRVGEESYHLGLLPLGDTTPYSLRPAMRDYERRREGREKTKRFLEAVEAGGGRVEKR